MELVVQESFSCLAEVAEQWVGKGVVSLDAGRPETYGRTAGFRPGLSGRRPPATPKVEAQEVRVPNGRPVGLADSLAGLSGR